MRYSLFCWWCECGRKNGDGRGGGEQEGREGLVPRDDRVRRDRLEEYSKRNEPVCMCRRTIHKEFNHHYI